MTWKLLSLSIPKETFNFCSCRAQIAENQTQNPILWVAKLQCKLKSEGIDEEEMGSWNLEWNMWEHPDEVKDIEFLNPVEASLPEVAFLSLFEEIYPALPYETVMASLRQFPCKTLILFRTHAFHSSLLLEL